jgi:chromosome partitioning protein
MRTISIISQKGGAGKTTLAVHLATAAAAERVTLLIDTDPQATASRWSQWRSGADPEVIDCGAPSLLADKLSKAEGLGAELVVIDTPPHADAMARQAAKLADLMLGEVEPNTGEPANVKALPLDHHPRIAVGLDPEVVPHRGPKGLDIGH